MPDESTWITDGTTEAEPVTTETPADEVSAEPIDEPTVIEAPATTEPVSVETAEVVEATDEVPAEEIVQKFIEGKLGDDVFQIPEGLMVPQTRGGETEMVSFEDVLRDGMKGNDYRLKTTEVAQLRRGVDTDRDEITRREARMEARAKYLDERDAEMKAALTDPKSAEAYQEHLVQYANNAMYRKNVDAGLANEETKAELSALQEREDARVVNEASKTVFGWIDDLKAEYEGVDPERVRQEYSRLLKDGKTPLDISAVRSVYEAEKDYVNRTVSPLRDELAGIKAQLESLQASKVADQQNETTQHAVKRAKTVPVATGSGAPAKGHVPPSKFGPHELAERNQEWANVR